MGLFIKVFEDDIRLCPAIILKLTSLSISYPTFMAESSKPEDSGIFLIRNMQHYKHKWFETAGVHFDVLESIA